MITFVKCIAITLRIHYNVGDLGQHGLCDRFRNLLACPVLRYVTVKVGLGGDWEGDVSDALDRHSQLGNHSHCCRGIYQKLKGKLGVRLKFETIYLDIGENIKAWEERMGKAEAKKHGL